MKVSTRIGTGFGLLVLLLIICTGVAFNGLTQAQRGMDDVVNNRMKRLTLALDMRGNVRDMAIAVRNMALMSSPEEMQLEWQRLETQRDKYIKERELLVKNMSQNVTANGKAVLEEVLAAEDDALKTLINAGKMALQNNDQETTAYLLKTVRPAQQRLLKGLNELADIQKQLSNDRVHELSDNVANARLMLALLCLFSVITAVSVCIVICRILMRQLGGEPAQAQALAAAIAAGDLTVPVILRRNDTSSLLASLDGMKANLRGLVSQIRDASASVALAADEISQGNTELSSRTEQQAAALQETAASMGFVE